MSPPYRMRASFSLVVFMLFILSEGQEHCNTKSLMPAFHYQQFLLWKLLPLIILTEVCSASVVVAIFLKLLNGI